MKSEDLQAGLLSVRNKYPWRMLQLVDVNGEAALEIGSFVVVDDIDFRKLVNHGVNLGCHGFCLALVCSVP